MGYALGSAEYKAMLLLLMVVVLCVFEIFLFFVVCFWRQRGLVSFDFFFFFSIQGTGDWNDSHLAPFPLLLSMKSSPRMSHM